MEKKSGIIGFTGAFRESVKEINTGSKIVFIGSVAVCTPFIELLSYTIRDKDFQMVYVPNAVLNKTKMINEQQDIGFSVVNVQGDPKSPDVVVVMGGLAMPKFGCSPDDVLEMINEISGKEKPKIIGICFMNIFEKQGWTKKISFDVLIDTKMETIIS